MTGLGGGADASRLLYRAMYESSSGLPVFSPHSLGVRVPTDVRPDAAGIVHPGRGMSVAPDDPMLLPDHLRPACLGGSSDRSLWAIPAHLVQLPLLYRQNKPTHGMIEPAEPIALTEYLNLLEKTARDWTKIYD